MLAPLGSSSLFSKDHLFIYFGLRIILYYFIIIYAFWS